MDILDIKKRLKEAKKEKKTNAVLNLISDYHKAFSDNNLIDSIQLRMHEIDSFISVVHAAMQSNLYDEDFYRKQVQTSFWLLEERYDELQLMVSELIGKNIAKEAAVA